MVDVPTYLSAHNISFSENVDLKTKTWIKRGGIARYWIQPENLFDFEKLIIFCHEQNVFIEIIGNTSNCYFFNDYSPNVVISTLKLREMQVFDDRIICDCGFQMSILAKFCNENGFARYEGFVGLPGTVGGAVVNNAGCYGSLIADVVKEVMILQDGKLKVLTNQQLCYENRTSILKKKEIDAVILSVIFDIRKRDEPEVLKRKSIEYQKHRITLQEHTYPNLGTIFCEMDFKYPILMFIRSCLDKMVKISTKNELKQQYSSVMFFLLLYRAGKFRKYVSKHGVQCFTWKDEYADEAFLQYIEFVKKRTKKAIMEIEIKGQDETSRNHNISCGL
jgi:UDP-N-acetylmuramate dehydrogenase